MYCKTVGFNDLANSDLYIDCIYEGGTRGNYGDDPLSKLLQVGIAGGFRKVMRKDDKSKPAFVVLYTTMSELEWPDYLDTETGIFRYYGDNRVPGRDLLDTKFKGNKLLQDVFSQLNSNDLNDIPPFFIFKSTGKGRDVQFLGLAAPGGPNISTSSELNAFWRTVKDNRFQNYEAYFTVLNTLSEPIHKEWINALIYDHNSSLQYAPDSWKKFIKYGRNGIEPLCAPKNIIIPNKYDQLQSDQEGMFVLDKIRDFYKTNPYGFEFCSTDIIKKMDNHFSEFTLTRPWRDGGRDAIGTYVIDSGSASPNQPLKFECSLEAKCYSKDTQVGVKQMSRLISRIKYRQFGIMITTGSVNSQAYKEVYEDRHPIIIVTASDIASILRRNAIDKHNVDDWLKTLDEREKSIARFE